MTLDVKLFGMLKTLLKQESDLTLELHEGSQVNDLIAKVQKINPDLGDLLLKKKVLVYGWNRLAEGCKTYCEERE